MGKLYQVLNDNYQPVIILNGLEAAKQHIVELQKTYKEEAFYIIELEVVHYAPPTL